MKKVKPAKRRNLDALNPLLRKCGPHGPDDRAKRRIEKNKLKIQIRRGVFEKGVQIGLFPQVHFNSGRIALHSVCHSETKKRNVIMGIIKRIHVNQHNIRRNNKEGTNDPCVTCKTSRGNFYGHEVEILGPSKVAYSPKKPLSCGARVWVETKSPIKLIHEDGSEEIID